VAFVPIPWLLSGRGANVRHARYVSQDRPSSATHRQMLSVNDEDLRKSLIQLTRSTQAYVDQLNDVLIELLDKLKAKIHYTSFLV